MAHGALGARLSCLLELNVIYTAERWRIEVEELKRGGKVLVSVWMCLKCEQE